MSEAIHFIAYYQLITVLYQETGEKWISVSIVMQKTKKCILTQLRIHDYNLKLHISGTSKILLIQIRT